DRDRGGCGDGRAGGVLTRPAVRRITGLLLLPADPGGGDDGDSEGRRRSKWLALSSEGCRSGTAAPSSSGTAAVRVARADRMSVARMKVAAPMRTGRTVAADRLPARLVIRMQVCRERSPGVGVIDRTRRRAGLGRLLFGQRSQAGGVPGQSDDEEGQRAKKQQTPRRGIFPQVQQRDRELAIHQHRHHDAGKDHAQTPPPERLLIPSRHRATSWVLKLEAKGAATIPETKRRCHAFFSPAARAPQWRRACPFSIYCGTARRAVDDCVAKLTGVEAISYSRRLGAAAIRGFVRQNPSCDGP